MKITRLKRWLLVAAFAAFALSAICLMLPPGAAAAQQSVGENLVSVIDYDIPNSSYTSYFDITEGEDAEHGTYVRFRVKEGVQTTSYTIFYYVDWQANVTYNVSFWFRTNSEWADNNESGNYFAPRTGSSLYQPDEHRLGVSEEWTMHTVTYTPAVVETSNNALHFCITAGSGSEFYLADIRVYTGDQDDCGGVYRLSRDNYVVNAGSGLDCAYGIDTESAFGEESVFADGLEIFSISNDTEGAITGDIYMNMPVYEGVKYKVTYYVRFVREVSATLRFQPMININGADVPAEAADSVKSQYFSDFEGFENALKLSNPLNPPYDKWHIFSYTFTPVKSDENAALKFRLGNMGAGDEIYLAAVKAEPENCLYISREKAPEYLKESGEFEDIYYTSCIYCGKSSAGTGKESVFSTLNETLETVGAAIRIAEGETGSMRFISRFSKEKLAGITGEYEIGTVIKGGVYEGDTLTADTEGAVNVVNLSGCWQETAEDMFISAYIWGIDEAHYNTEITARAYIKITENGAERYIYGDAAVRSLAEMAASALKDLSDTEGGVYVYPAEDGRFSPYDENTRAQLSIYAGME